MLITINKTEIKKNNNKECYAKGCVLFKNLWFHDENARYFNEWDTKMSSLNVWVDMLWLTLAAKMLNTNLRIYSPRWKSGPTTMCIDPFKPIDVFKMCPCPRLMAPRSRCFV